MKTILQAGGLRHRLLATPLLLGGGGAALAQSWPVAGPTVVPTAGVHAMPVAAPTALPTAGAGRLPTAGGARMPVAAAPPVPRTGGDRMPVAGPMAMPGAGGGRMPTAGPTAIPVARDPGYPNNWWSRSAGRIAYPIVEGMATRQAEKFLFGQAAPVWKGWCRLEDCR